MCAPGVEQNDIQIGLGAKEDEELLNEFAFDQQQMAMPSKSAQGPSRIQDPSGTHRDNQAPLQPSIMKSAETTQQRMLLLKSQSTAQMNGPRADEQQFQTENRKDDDYHNYISL